MKDFHDPVSVEGGPAAGDMTHLPEDLPKAVCRKPPQDTVFYHYELSYDIYLPLYHYVGLCHELHPEDDPATDRWACKPPSPQ